MNDPTWFSQTVLQGQMAGLQTGAARHPLTAKDILGYALSQAKQRRDTLQKELDNMSLIREEILNLDALIARFEGSEDE